ncbi:biopolymer transporter ExbD [Thiotrichales bacterium 19S3-7]|nr:biopolymer transporter ExbD [Thiotrichales bacterium 19S3-7]MCF6802841.1 biopolymer transporter ExbD [Thiotrichales bacterium 19S3-11]
MIRASKLEANRFVDEPNLVPLLDFLLVLLIMFTLLAGPIQHFMNIKLPQISQRQASTHNNQKSIDVILYSVNKLAINNQTYHSFNQFKDALTNLSSHQSNKIVIKTDKNLPVEIMLSVFSLAKELKFNVANVQIDQN